MPNTPWCPLCFDEMVQDKSGELRHAVARARVPLGVKWKCNHHNLEATADSWAKLMVLVAEYHGYNVDEYEKDIEKAFK